jgi:hypothetical protein
LLYPSLLTNDGLFGAVFVCPGRQRQSLTFVFVTDDVFEFTGQLEHGSLPSVGLYFANAQVVQVPPSGPLKPALHTHAVIAELAFGEFEFAGHGVHDKFPVVLLYVPATHAVQLLKPIYILKPGPV